MIPVFQKIKHDPDSGKYGDCMRACIASLLELKIEDVPHFFENGNADDFNKKVGVFLASKGYALLSLNCWEIKEEHFYFKKNIPHLISAITKKGTYHATVGIDGKIVHDPSGEALINDESFNKTFDFLIKI